ncbi:DUF4153 domain-containing protein [Pedobacter sp. L105]|uniref:DUF4153 domain-containing protein n=1 Tax=Pedobacter sp. L105 TaxID=1641871 RepID=UPI00131B33AC|nr:DUF4153 domain-containing protein [Pedobacter sp. L105]
MALPSIQNLIENIKYVIRRFPLEIIFAVIGTTAAIVGIETPSQDSKIMDWCIRIVMIANLGLVVSLSTSLYLEHKAVKGMQLYIYKALIALFVINLIWFINPFERSADTIRFTLMSLAAHLLVSFSAYIHADSIQGFWQFNKTIFIRFLTGALYSAVLFLGLAGAIGATKFLFNIDLGSNIYAKLWIFTAGIFNTVFFLAGIPKDLDTLNNDFTYPKGLKVFTQYVLIPLATVYVIILLAYEAKILVQWNLPKGLVANLILGYAVFGILSLLLVFPIREQAENGWIKTYARSFYFLMLPLIVLLFLAVGARVFSYGITEKRYFLIMLAFWLLFITVYFLLSRKQNIKLVPISLCIFTIVCIYGPQSAFSVSSYSQVKILTNIFKRNHAYKDHKITAIKNIPLKDGNYAASTLRYIIEQYGYGALQPYINKELDQVTDSLSNSLKKGKPNRYSLRYDLDNLKINWLQNYLGLGDFSTHDIEDYSSYKHRSRVDSYFIKDIEIGLVEIKGYDYILQESSFEQDTNINATRKITVKESMTENGVLSLRLNNDTALFDLKEFLNQLLKSPEKLKTYKVSNNAEYTYSLPAAMLGVIGETKNFKVVYKINSIRFNRDKNKTIKKITYNNGVFLIKAK